ncbi:MAG TPA: hypothetical protein VFZ66_17745 [Herpetosiphonaceae bacterium]
MTESAMFILLVVFVLFVVQLMAITSTWHRLTARLHRSADTPPFNTVLTIESVGQQPVAVTRLLERMTRLDVGEIDRLARRGGRLPLPMSRPAALRLAQELRRVGAEVQIADRETRQQPVA